MNQVRLRTVRNMETGKELTVSSSKAKELIRREGWIEVRPEIGKGACGAAARPRAKGFLALAVRLKLIAGGMPAFDNFGLHRKKALGGRGAWWAKLLAGEAVGGSA